MIRHGQTAHNAAFRFAGWTDSELTPHGLAQAALVAGHLRGQAVDVIYTSPLARARRTAEVLGDALDHRPVEHDRLKEIHFGEIENLTADEAEARFPNIWNAAANRDDDSFAWPGGESRRGFHERILGAFDEIVGRHRGQVVAVVAHGGVLGAFLANVLLGSPALWTEYLLHNCSLTELDLDAEGRPTLVRCNDVSHLADAPPAPIVAGSRPSDEDDAA